MGGFCKERSLRNRYYSRVKMNPTLSLSYFSVPPRLWIIAALSTVLGALVYWLLFGPPDDGTKEK